MTNSVGMLHDGVICGMIDECMGVNFICLGLEHFYPTINLNVDFFTAAKEGEIVVVRTQELSKENQLSTFKQMFSITNQSLVAQASSNLAASSRHV